MSSKHKPEIEYLTSDGMKSFPLSEAVRVGNTLYLSGQIGMDSSGKLVSGGIVVETRQTMENIKATLERYGSLLDHIIKATGAVEKPLFVIASDQRERGNLRVCGIASS